MNKDMPIIKPAKDKIRTMACEFIKSKYGRGMDWAYMVSRKDPKVQYGPYYKDALKDYEAKYNELKAVLS